MNLYTLINEGHTSDNEETVREIVLLLHEQKMTEEEFHKTVDKYFWDEGWGGCKIRRRFFSLVCCLTDNEGFTKVPTYSTTG
jgi:hypothetical protein